MEITQKIITNNLIWLHLKSDQKLCACLFGFSTIYPCSSCIITSILINHICIIHDDNVALSLSPKCTATTAATATPWWCCVNGILLGAHWPINYHGRYSHALETRRTVWNELQVKSIILPTRQLGLVSCVYARVMCVMHRDEQHVRKIKAMHMHGVYCRRCAHIASSIDYSFFFILFFLLFIIIMHIEMIGNQSILCIFNANRCGSSLIFNNKFHI